MPRWLASPVLGVLVAAAMLSLGTQTARADPRDFTFINGSGVVITHVYVTHQSYTDWDADDDILGRDVLDPGESTFVTFSRYDGEAGLCMYDFMVLGKADYEGYLLGVNLCETVTVTFY